MLLVTRSYERNKGHREKSGLWAPRHQAFHGTRGRPSHLSPRPSSVIPIKSSPTTRKMSELGIKPELRARRNVYYPCLPKIRCLMLCGRPAVPRTPRISSRSLLGSPGTTPSPRPKGGPSPKTGRRSPESDAPRGRVLSC